MSGDTEVTLNPGDFHFGAEGTVIRTLLGSCISVTVWHPKLRIGGMCHYMMPSRPRPQACADLDGRFADEAMEMFLREIKFAGTRPQDYQVNIFGGGTQFVGAALRGPLNIAGDNVRAGLRLLDELDFTLDARDVGGSGPRLVVFDVSSGHVWLKHVELADVGVIS